MTQYFEGYEHSMAEMNDMTNFVNEINNNTQDSYEQNEQSFNDLNAGVRSNYKMEQINLMIKQCMEINKAMTNGRSHDRFIQQTEESYHYEGGNNVSSDYYKNYTMENIQDHVEMYQITNDEIPIQKNKRLKRRVVRTNRV